MTMRAFITGAVGQDGSYLAELLHDKGYEVHGFARRGSKKRECIDHLHEGDLLDPASLTRALNEAEPHEIYNLGAQSHVGASFDCPEYTLQVTALPLETIFRYVKEHGRSARIYQASTSEMFGNSPGPQNERTTFDPQSPYAVAKLAAHHRARVERARGTFVSSGILFNHESERRPPSFVTRKVTIAAAKISLGLQNELILGTLDAARDWGYAPEYVEAMWRMLQGAPGEYVIATGETHTIGELVEAAFKAVGCPDWQKYVKVNSKNARPAEVYHLCGDASKALTELGWEPQTKFHRLVRLMVEHDLEFLNATHRQDAVPDLRVAAR
jgi:GDPmannose 4,6-dehydratase